MNNFVELYTRSIKAHADHSFLSCYDAHFIKTQKSFAEFHIDVNEVFIELSATDREIIVLVSGNTYLHLVYIVATWLCGKSHCSINPAESSEYINEKLRIFGSDYVVFSDDDRFGYRPMRLHGGSTVTEFLNYKQRTQFTMNYVFTSGSTGESKVVPQSQESVLANYRDLVAHHKLGTDSVVATSLPVFHVNALNFSFLSCLLSGAKLVLLEQFSVSKIGPIVEQEKVDILSLVPQLLSGLVRSAHLTKPDYFSRLKYFVSAAAPLSRDVTEKIFNTYNKRIVQGYGLSEAVNFSCLTPIDLAVELYRSFYTQSEIPSIGVELSPGTVALFDADLQSVNEENRVGQLAVTGVTVMENYLNRVDRSDFVGKYFLTGDLAYYRLDSENRRFYFITGRQKEICKRNAFNIPLAEVDKEIQKLLGEDFDCCAVSFPNVSAGEELGVLVKPLKPLADEQETVRYVENRLVSISPHLKPAVVIVTDQVFRSPSGKSTRWKFLHFFKPFENKNFVNSHIVKKETGA